MGTRLRDNHNIDKTVGTRVDSALPTERTLARVCREATQCCLDRPKSWSLASGITAGSTIRLPVPNTNFGRRWCLPSRVLQTRPTCDRTPDHVPARCCMGPPLQQSSSVQPLLFRTLVLERLRLPRSITEARCERGGSLDYRRQQRAARPRSGRLRSRALSLSRACAARLAPL